MAHQVLDRLAAVVARHVGVQVEPDALDAVVVRAVWREEVEDDAVAELGEARSPSRAGGQDEGDLVDANDWRNLLSRGTGEGFAEVEFECGLRVRGRPQLAGTLGGPPRAWQAGRALKKISGEGGRRR